MDKSKLTRDEIASVFLNQTFTPTQKEVINNSSKWNYIMAAKGWGKSYMIAVLSLLEAIENPGIRIGIFAPSFRQSKLIFAEIKKIIAGSKILQGLVTSYPIVDNRSCSLTFKNVLGKEKNSVITSFSLGDGSRVCGYRCQVVFLDECLHLPEEQFNMVLRPMQATTINPLESMELSKIADIIKKAKINEDSKAKLVKGVSEAQKELYKCNKSFLFSGGYYKYNYMYKIWDFYNNGDGKYKIDNRHKTFQFSYLDWPTGFLDYPLLEQAIRDLPEEQFKMEFCAEWVDDEKAWLNKDFWELVW